MVVLVGDMYHAPGPVFLALKVVPEISARRRHPRTLKQGSAM
jgi:hypothetical protein